MQLLGALLALNALVHAVIVARYGLRGNNQPFLVFAVVYALLATAVLLAVRHALWATFGLSIFGFTGLNLTFNKPVRDKTLDRVIWGLDAVIILLAGYRLFVA